MRYTLKTLYPSEDGADMVEVVLPSAENSLAMGQEPIKRRTGIMRNQREFNFLTFIIVVAAVIIAMRFIK